MATALKMATILLLCMMIVSQPFTAVQAAVTCSTVASIMRPCISYLQKGGAVPGVCCSGIRSFAAGSTRKDRQTACTCLKSAGGSIKGINLRYAAGLPRACNINFPIAISPSTDCSKVS